MENKEERPNDVYKEMTILKMLNQLVDSLKREKDEMEREVEEVEAKAEEDWQNSLKIIKELWEYAKSIEKQTNQESTKLLSSRNQ